MALTYNLRITCATTNQQIAQISRANWRTSVCTTDLEFIIKTFKKVNAI